jgi:putative membrane-bound dehydrogenase-like protein
MQIEFRNTVRELTGMLGAAAILFQLSAGVAAEPAGPLSPKQEQASFHFADDALTVDLIAAEPEVVSPVAITFDADGRLFVAEMLDYPNSLTSGRIRLLEDRDGDGRYETANVFADKLPFPNGVLPWRGGVLVTAAPDIWYLSDTNGDGHADERRVLFTGFGLGNQQLRVNGLTWGLDNWVYGANGRSEGEIRRPGDSPGKTISIRGHDLRFRPDTGEFEAIAGRSQFGLARDDWGNRFLSWNTIPIRHDVLPARYLNRNPQLAATESVADIIEPGDAGRVFPLAPPPLTFNNESVKNFNALSGLTIFRASGLGEEYRGNAFVGESLLNLVHRRVLEPDGVTFVARRGEWGKEFLVSTDPWFHPVNFATGPDGALYVVDFYRKFVEHPDWVHNAARDEVPWRTGAGHGRLWRVRSSKSPVPNRKINLRQAAWPEVVEHLRNDNGWWRDTAQRLLVERQERMAIPALEKLVRQASPPLARLHALCTLDGLHAFTPDLLLTALKDSQPGVREHALRLSEGYLANEQVERLRPAVAALAEDPDVRVRFQVAMSLGEFNGAGKLDALARIARRAFASHWQRLAVLSSVGSNAWPLLRKLAQEEPAWLNAPTTDQARFLDQAARLVGASHNEAELKECLTLLTLPVAKPPASGHLALLAGLADGLSRTPRPLRELMSNPPGAIKSQIQSLGTLVDIAIARAVLPQENVPARLDAIRILARVTPESSGATLLDLLQAHQPAEVQSAAARALAELNTDTLAQAIYSRWNQYAATTRRRVLAAIPQSTAMSAALAAALERGNLSPIELDASVRQSLLKTSNDPLKQRFERLLATAAAPDRQEVVARFQAAVKLKGDRPRGAAIFAKTCLLCHIIEGQGRHVGPDLSGIASRPKEALLVDILDPSRQVSPDFINYTLVTTDGNLVTGLIVSETAVGVTLRRAGETDDTILHSQIKELRAEGKSLMPEGLEQGLVPRDMADLLSFLQKPEGRLLPDAK